VCGRLAENPLQSGIDALFVKSKSKGFETVCEECFRRIRRLYRRFRPSFGGYV